MRVWKVAPDWVGGTHRRVIRDSACGAFFYAALSFVADYEKARDSRVRLEEDRC